MGKIRAKSGKAIYRQITRAYWPDETKNTSADREAGSAVVDSLTLAQLRAFFEYANFAGPTYCMVKEHVGKFVEMVFPKRSWHTERSRMLMDLRQFHRDIRAEIQECEDGLEAERETVEERILG